MTSHQPVALVVDDEASIRELIGRFAERHGFRVIKCEGGAGVLAYLAEHTADVALVDLQMPEIGGLAVLKAIREADPQCQTILMTGHSSLETAVQAIQLGALDYLPKPLPLDRLAQLLDGVQADIERRRAVMAADQQAARHLECGGMIGRAPGMLELFRLIRRLAPHARTALVTGETGTGKELVARALHDFGPRRGKRFVTINCSAVVETLFESELFGHVRGAFTGASEHKAGLFEAADGGTIFLDEIGELPLAVQAKLLRVLESGDVQRVGAVQGRRVDVHVIAATNRDLAAEAAAGRFRSDLYYRLNVVELHVPPLAERRDDIPYLVAAFIRDCAERFGKTITGITTDAERLLVTSAWPGNVRQLRNAVERACMMAEGELLGVRDFGLGGQAGSSAPPPDVVPLRPVSRLDEREREHILRVLSEASGNKSEAAKALGISRRAFYRKLDRHGLARREAADDLGPDL